MTDRPRCQHGDCPRPATIAIRTTRTKSGGLRSTVDWFEEDGAKAATRYCGECGGATLAAIARDLATEAKA